MFLKDLTERINALKAEDLRDVPSTEKMEARGGELTISIDLSRYPKLHSRLIGLALDQVLAEMEKIWQPCRT